MTKFEIPLDERLEDAKRKFSELNQMKELLSATTGKRISPSRLFTYVTEAVTVDPDIEAALAADENLRRVYRDMLEQGSTYHVPEAMAASSGEWPVREGKGCRIRLEPSRAEPDQIYVIVELTGDEGNTATALVICDTDNNCRRYALPGVRDGVAQIITGRDSDLVGLLKDPKTEAFIR